MRPGLVHPSESIQMKAQRVAERRFVGLPVEGQRFLCLGLRTRSAKAAWGFRSSVSGQV